MMTRSFLQSILTWFAGLALGFILTALVFKLSWENKEHILILGYGGITSVIVFYVKFSTQIKKKDMDLIDERLKLKAEFSEIKTLQCQIDLVNKTIEHSLKEQEEMHATVDNIYSLLLNK